jgi:hypothetical protein
MRAPKHLLTGLVAAALMTACIAPAVHAQNAVKPPTPRKSDDPPYIWNIFVLIVVVGKIVGGNANAIYILDASNQEVLAARWNESSKAIDVLGYRDLQADAQASPNR